jgi:hypothetical protein
MHLNSQRHQGSFMLNTLKMPEPSGFLPARLTSKDYLVIDFGTD